MNKISISVYLLHILLQKPASKSFSDILQLASYGNNTQPIHDFLERAQSVYIHEYEDFHSIQNKRLGLQFVSEAGYQNYNPDQHSRV